VRPAHFLSKAQLKRYARLREKKIRDAEHLFLAEGDRVVHQLLCTLPHPDMLVALLFNQSAPPHQPVTLYRDKHFFLSPKEFANIADVEEPQSLMAVFKQPHHSFDDVLHRHSTLNSHSSLLSMACKMRAMWAPSCALPLGSMSVLL
jgi:hypothetical protein